MKFYLNNFMKIYAINFIKPSAKAFGLVEVDGQTQAILVLQTLLE